MAFPLFPQLWTFWWSKKFSQILCNNFQNLNFATFPPDAQI